MPAPGRNGVGNDEPDDQRQRREEQEIGATALPATRPTERSSRMPAMPVTSVRKITGAMIIFTSLMKASPSGFSLPAKRLEMAERDAQRDGDEHLHVELAIPRHGLGRRGGSGGVAWDTAPVAGGRRRRHRRVCAPLAGQYPTRGFRCCRIYVLTLVRECPFAPRGADQSRTAPLRGRAVHQRATRTATGLRRSACRARAAIRPLRRRPATLPSRSIAT